MEKHLFKCSSCGYEIYLQAWKAVCPRCERGYTLVRVIEPTREPRIRPRFAGAGLLLLYLALTIIAPGATAVSVAPPILIQILLAAAAVFLLTGSLPSIILASSIAIGILAYHLPGVVGSLQQAALSAIALLIIASSVSEELLIRRRKRGMRGQGKERDV